VLLVDDSIVRGTTMRRIISLLRKLNPASIHVAIFSPPVRHPCFYGIDMPSKKELVASEAKDIVSVESMLREHLSADSMTYLSVEGLAAVGGKDICSACFTGQYIVPLSVDEEQMIVKERRPE
jgi:amidophosphoribosyltransferase